MTLTTLPDSAAQADATPFDETAFEALRLAELGRASQNLIGSLDAGLELAQGTTSYVYLGTRIIRGWAIELVLLTALLPFLIGTIDLFAHCRRRRIPRARRADLRGRLYFWGYAGALVFVAALLGAFPSGEARPLPPDQGLYTPSPVVLGILGVLLFVGWLVVRERLLPRRPARPEETLAGHTVALLGLGLIALLVVATNPFSLVYLLPSLYAWLWLPQATRRAQLARAGLLVVGFAGPPAPGVILDPARTGIRDALVPCSPHLRRLRALDRRCARLRLARRRRAADDTRRRQVCAVSIDRDPPAEAVASSPRRPAVGH